MSQFLIKMDCTDDLPHRLLSIRETKEHKYIQSLPIDIYSRKIKEIENSLDNLIAFSKDPTESFEHVVHPVKAYVQALASFYDNLFRILKYTQNIGSKTDSNDAIRWIIDHGTKKNKSFFKQTRSQQKLISKIDNKFKHDDIEVKNCEITKTYFSKSKKVEIESSVKGFYINTAIDTVGLWAPDPEIHTYIDEITATAFSFNFFILNTCYSLVHWINVMKRIIKVNGKNENIKYKDTSLEKILYTASNVPELFFPDEYNKAYAKVTKLEEGYEVIYPYRYSTTSKDLILLNGRISGALNFNPRTSSCNQKIPYLNLKDKYWR